ncbi:MAG: GC-type dockerin domain-anchored protein [Phycisphaerales bacterium JB050]
MTNCRLNAVLAATIVSAASTTMSVADGPGDDCNSASECWSLHICTAVVECFTAPGIDDALRQECFDTILNTGYTSCMANVCSQNYVDGEHSPNPQNCLNQYLEFLENCSNWGEFSNDRLNCNFHPDIMPSPEQRQAMTNACAAAARKQYRMCDHIANGGDPGNFDPNAGIATIADGAAATGEFDPAEGVNHATWLRVPQVQDGDVAIDAARLHALLWTEGEGWSWSVVGEYGTADDGMVSVDFDLSSVDSAAWIHDLQLVIEWRNEGETVTATPMRLDIANSDIAADYNRDGVVTLVDLTSFLDAYSASAPRADFNVDGVVNAADLGAFIEVFEAN